MKAELDFQTEELTFDVLLDKINVQRKANSELQAELSSLRSRENRLHKTSEAVKLENRRLHEDIAALEQKIRELDIQLTLPESERTYTASRAINPGVKFKIREQSPNKMTRAILVDGKTLTVEDYFYKISDKEQWIFGFFTNRRTYNLGK